MRILTIFALLVMVLLPLSGEENYSIIVDHINLSSGETDMYYRYSFDEQGLLSNVHIHSYLTDTTYWIIEVVSAGESIAVSREITAPGLPNAPKFILITIKDNSFEVSYNHLPEIARTLLIATTGVVDFNMGTELLHQLSLIDDDQVSHYSVRGNHTIGFHINEPEGIFEVYDERGGTQRWQFIPDGYRFYITPSDNGTFRVDIHLSEDYTPPTDPFIKAANWYIAYFISQPYMLPFLTGQFR